MLMDSLSLGGDMILPLAPLLVALSISEDSTRFVANVHENTIIKVLSFTGTSWSL
jgi:hypothetical protein